MHDLGSRLFVSVSMEGGCWVFMGGRVRHRGNKPALARKSASFLAPPTVFSHRLHHRQPPSASLPLMQLLCEDAPPAAGGCITVKLQTTAAHVEALQLLKTVATCYLSYPDSLRGSLSCFKIIRIKAGGLNEASYGACFIPTTLNVSCSRKQNF